MRKETGEKHKFQLASLSQVRAITHTGCFAPLVTSSIRYGRITSRLVTFKSKVKGLVHKLKTQGYKFEDLRRLSLRFFKERREIIAKFDIANGNDFLKVVFH